MQRFRARLSAPLGLACACCFSSSVLADPHTHEHEHEHADTEVIVITHSPLEHDPDELAIPVDRLDRAELLEQLGSTLGDTLSRRPGIATTGFAAGASRPVIRGQDAFRTEVVEGGLATQDVSRLSPDHGIPINPLAVDFIEVVRGPATLRYGGGASAGVVNAVTNTVPREPVEGTLQGELYGAYGSNAAAVDLAGEVEVGLGERTALHVDGLSRDAGDYDVPGDGGQPGTAYDAAAVAIGASHFFDAGRIGVAWSHYDNEYGIPEDEAVQIDMRSNRVRLEGDLEEPLQGIRELRLRGAYTDYEHDEIAEGEVGQTFDNDELELRLEALHDPWVDFVGAVGVHVKYRDFEAGGEAAEFLAPAETDSVAFYLFEERQLADHVALELGFRAETTRVDGAPRDAARRQESFVPISGSVAVVADPFPDWVVGVRGAVTQRAPSDVELFARGPHEATGTFELGDADLDEETGYTAELRVEGRVGPVELHVSPYFTYYTGYVFGRLTGVTVDEDGDPAGDELDELLYEARDTRFAGFELSFESDLFELGDCGGVGLDGQLDYVRAMFDGGDAVDGDEDLPRITPLRWGAGVFWEWERLRARVGFLRVEAQDDLAAGEARTDDYTLVDASLTWQIVRPGEDGNLGLEAFAIGRNLANEGARNHLAFNKDEVQLPGLDIRTGLRATF